MIGDLTKIVEYIQSGGVIALLVLFIAGLFTRRIVWKSELDRETVRADQAIKVAEQWQNAYQAITDTLNVFLSTAENRTTNQQDTNRFLKRLIGNRE
jgi:transposase-like protein